MNSAQSLRLAAALLLSAALTNEASAETVYFQVAEIHSPCSACDSYVLPISDPSAIEHARDLVSRGSVAGSALIMANAVVGGDGINRDMLAPGTPPWSWHVTSLVDFADLAIELCDGNPTLVEADPTGFLANTGGAICFWGYTVTAELPAPRAPPLGSIIPPAATLMMLLTGIFALRKTDPYGFLANASDVIRRSGSALDNPRSCP